jgi:hypothetical protein
MASNINKLPKEELEKLRTLRDRSPDEWVERINALPESIREFAARLVWWDYFALRTVGDRWPHLDTYLKFTNEEAPYGPLVEALVELGYPEKTALTRADDPRSN